MSLATYLADNFRPNVGYGESLQDRTLGAFQLIAEGGATAQTAEVTLTVHQTPGVGQYTSVNAALAAASTLTKGYVQRGFLLRILLLSGFIWAEQVFIYEQDLGHIQIDSEDATVPMSRAAIIASGIGNGAQNPPGTSTNNWRTGTLPAICGMRGSKLPIWNILGVFNTDTVGENVVGMYVFEKSEVIILRTKGIRNSGWRGLYVDGAGSTAYARQSDWQGSGLEGFSGDPTACAAIRASNGANVMARSASVINSRDGVYATGSFAWVVDVNASGCTNVGVGATDGAIVTCGGAIVDNVAVTALRASSGAKLEGTESEDVNGRYVSAIGCGGNALELSTGGRAVLPLSTLASTTTHAVSMAGGSEANLVGAIVSTAAGRALSAGEGCTVTAHGARFTGAADYAVRLFNDSIFKGSGARFEGFATGDIQVNTGSEAHVNAATRADGVTNIVTNVTPGERTADGAVFDGRTANYVNAVDASFALTRTIPRNVSLTANVSTSGGRTLTLYDATSYQGKTHRITYAGTGNFWNINNSTATRVFTLRPGESCIIEPNPDGTWRVVSSQRKIVQRDQTDADTTLVVGQGNKIRTTTLTANRTLTLYAADDPAAEELTFIRPDAGLFDLIIVNPAATEILRLAAGQMGIVYPRAANTTWVKQSKTAVLV